jgi:hypothetical protein
MDVLAFIREFFNYVTHSDSKVLSVGGLKYPAQVSREDADKAINLYCAGALDYAIVNGKTYEVWLSDELMNELNAAAHRGMQVTNMPEDGQQ